MGILRSIIREAINRELTIQNYNDALAKTSEGIKPHTLVDAAISADPTPQGKYVRWILDRYISGGIKRAEDFGRAGSALEFFDRRKKRLPVEQRDIQRIPDIYTLENLADKLSSEEERSGKEIKADEKARVMRDVRTIYDGPKGKILVPTTQESSCFLGRGTKWCTAAKKNNQFNYYNKQGDLYVIMPKDGRKFQFHLESGQLTDERDTPVDADSFMKQYPWVFDVLQLSEKTQLAAVKQYGYAIRFIKNPSEQVQLAAVERNGTAIGYIKKPSEQVQLAAVKQTGYAIEFINNPSERVLKRYYGSFT